MPIRSSVTVSLVPEVRGGPFVFWDDLPGAVRQAAELGFDAVEIFPPGPQAVDVAALRHLLTGNGLALAAVGTGAGWVLQRLSLTSPDKAVRERAVVFVKSIIDLAGPFGAPAIIGSMQGRWGEGVSKEAAAGYLREALEALGAHARTYNVSLLYEPLNRYETNLFNTVADTAAFMRTLSAGNVKILADLFHMNIEEADIAAGLRAGKGLIGHVHFVDSNRRPAGYGHIDYRPVAAALREIGYDGYLSAEAFAYPDSDGAARQTIAAFRKHFR
jgi:sugar phosphate isomerase/epimerase